MQLVRDGKYNPRVIGNDIKGSVLHPMTAWIVCTAAWRVALSKTFKRFVQLPNVRNRRKTPHGRDNHSGRGNEDQSNSAHATGTLTNNGAELRIGQTSPPV
jgi:hypothetical protein